jgi:hypothetical protein
VLQDIKFHTRSSVFVLSNKTGPGITSRQASILPDELDACRNLADATPAAHAMSMAKIIVASVVADSVPLLLRRVV